MANNKPVDIILEQQNYYTGPVTINQHGLDSSAYERAKTEVYVDDQRNAERKVPKLCQSIWDHKMKILSVIAITLVFVKGYLTLFPPKANKSNQGVKDFNAVGESSLRLINRQEWLARPALEGIDRLNLPVHRVIIASTMQENCSNQAICSYRTKVLQEYHMDSNTWDDIGYNFLVGGDGAVYEGRGWDAVGAHTKGYNLDSICVAFIGTFNKLAPPERQINAAKLIIEEGVRLNKLVNDYRIYGSRQLFATNSPGDALYEIIKKWPNWSNEI